jgi:hypothetical protein
MNSHLTLRLGVAFAALGLCAMTAPVAKAEVGYLNLSAPTTIKWPASDWEGDQQPHTFSVLEMNRGGYKYWSWYGLNNGRGMGLGRSNDLIHWTKYEGNPLWNNARWPSAIKGADKAHPDVVYLAVTRDYDTKSSRIALARTEDGIHLTEVKTLVQGVPNQRNQNPDLFRDPVSGKYFLTFYRGNDIDYFDIVSKSADSVEDLDKAPEKLLMHSAETVASPNLLYVPKGGEDASGIYYLATEIFPERYGKDKGVWQVKVFYSDKPDGEFKPVSGNPVQDGGRACLFQHVFNGKYYGYQSYLNNKTEKWDMEVLTAPLPK